MFKVFEKFAILWQLPEPFRKLKKKWGQVWGNRLWIILTSPPANKAGPGWTAVDRECRLHCGDVISGRGSGFIRRNQKVIVLLFLFNSYWIIFNSSFSSILDVLHDGRHSWGGGVGGVAFVLPGGAPLFTQPAAAGYLSPFISDRDDPPLMFWCLIVQRITWHQTVFISA